MFSVSLGLVGGLVAGRFGVEDLRVRAPFGRALLAFFVMGIMEKGGSYVTYLLW